MGIWHRERSTSFSMGYGLVQIWFNVKRRNDPVIIKYKESCVANGIVHSHRDIYDNYAKAIIALFTSLRVYKNV